MSDIRGIYKHFKGGEYEVFGTCFCEKTNQTFVLYKPLYNETGFWLRPYSMFFSEVIVDNNPKERFSFVKKTNPIMGKQTFQALDSEFVTANYKDMYGFGSIFLSISVKLILYHKILPSVFENIYLVK